MDRKSRHGSPFSGRYPKFPLLKCLGIGLFFLTLAGCTTVATNPYNEPGAGPSPSQAAVNACHPIAHLQCIYLTGRETLNDGADLKFTFHWWRMSYIGRACEEQYGRTVGWIVEGVSAIPHYAAIAVGNVAATLAYPFRNRREADEEEQSGLESAERGE